MILGIFNMFPIFYGINPAQAENPIFHILMFQWPKRHPNDLEIYEHQFLEGRRLGNEGSEQAEARGPRWVGPRGPCTWPRGTPTLALGAPLPSIFPPPTPFWPKNAYKNYPPTFSGRGAAETQNTETETWSCRLEGENSGGALPAWSPSSPTTSPPSPWWRGSSPPLDYGFVEVTYVSLSLELH